MTDNIQTQKTHEFSQTHSLKCTHCDEKIVIPLYNADDEIEKTPFCCQGCRTVFNVIHQKGLTDYYEIKNNSKIFKRRAPVELKNDRYLYLDAEDFVEEYCYKNNFHETTMEFYLEGVHCLACLWLIEKLPDIIPGVVISRLDMGRSVASVTINAEGKFSKVAYELSNLGYRPHPLKRNEDALNLKLKEERKNLFKIGIAGAASGNIMIYSVSIYAGAEGTFLKLFSAMTVLLAFPVILYSATPFYASAWNALKNKTINIDVPIALALIIGFIFGVVNLLMGNPSNYFDTLTDLVFFLLLSRYLLAKIQEKGLSANDLNFFYQSSSVLKKEGTDFIDIHPRYLKEGDIIKVQSLDMIPIDGIITEGESSVNNSLLTGESLPINVKVADLVYSGTQNIDFPLLIKVQKTEGQTRLGKILKEVESGWIQKARIVDFTNRFSKYFILVVFCLAFGALALKFFEGHYTEGIERALTLLIITCPCALALATPLTLTHTLSRASKKGLIIKNDEVIEKLSTVKEIFLDKTGTITYGNMKVDSFDILRPTNLNIYNIIATLEQKSHHPVARALKEYASLKSAIKIIPMTNGKEILGVGVSGSLLGKFYEIKNSKIYENGEVIAVFKLKDQIRDDSALAMKILDQLKIKTYMISGDTKEIAMAVGQQIGLSPLAIFAEVTPEKKCEIINQSHKAIMVGDGANDAMALSRAYVGVAVCGSMDISLRASDVYLTTPGIFPLIDLIIISKETMKVIYRNLTISIFYNIFSVIGVYLGLISPVAAAIIMPLSSISVLISTVIGTKALNKRLKE